MKRQCSTCRYCEYMDTIDEESLSQCKRYPPTATDRPVTEDNDYCFSAQPIVFPGDWCGEWSRGKKASL